MQCKNGKTMLFIGDSITDCNRRTTDAPLGNGYVKLAADMFMIRQSGKSFTFINKGINGDTAPGLRNRWSDDVLRHKPDIVSIKVGINDLHRTLRQSPEAVPPKLYAEAYEEIILRTRKALPKCKLLLIDPFYISTDTAPVSFRTDVLKLLPEYIKIVHRLAGRYNTLQVKTHELFQKLLKDNTPETFCPEPVHPNATGHLVIAEAVYAALNGKS